MANARPTAAHPGHVASPPMDRPEDLALPVATEAAPGADEVDAAALSVAVDETGPLEADEDYTGDWREDFGDSVGISSWREL